MPEPSASLVKCTLIFLGGGSGTLLRYWLGAIVQNWWGPAFPLGTLLVNLSGCLAMGFLATLWTGPVLIRDDCRSAVLIGVIGGYTTFSSFGRETLALLQDGEWGRAGAYVVGSVVLGLLAVWVGAVIATANASSSTEIPILAAMKTSRRTPNSWTISELPAISAVASPNEPREIQRSSAA